MLSSGQSVLVTGASGTVGSAVAERLAAEGLRVRATARGTTPSTGAIEQVAADLSDYAAVAAAASGMALAVHCAASLSSDAELCRQVNVDGTRNLVRALSAAGCRRLVHISSVSVYDVRAGWEVDEDSPLWLEAAGYPYGATKAESERIVSAAGDVMETVILRPASVLSLHPRSFWGPLALARAAVTSQPLFQLAELPFVHVDNLAEAVVLALRTDAAAGRIYNVVDGRGSTDAYLAAVAAAIGRAAPRLAKDGPIMRIAGERIRRELGYAPADRFQEFLSQLARLAGAGRA